MNSAERTVLSYFRTFDVGPNQMLCFQGQMSEKMQTGMKLLLGKGMVVKDRPKHAYSLTPIGYDASLEV